MANPLEQLRDNLDRLATHYDMLGAWPETSMKHLTDAGAWTWVIPKDYGGRSLEPVHQIMGYEAIGAGCMSTLLILTQRDVACELIAISENQEQKDTLLPKLLKHELMTSVGISQLTTSHQDKPALTAEPHGDGYRLRGFMPWVTAAEKCDFVVTGAALPDGQQILAIVPIKLEGVHVDPPMKLMALEPTRTSEVHCRDVKLSRSHVLAGPAENVLARRSPIKPLVVAASGIGLAGGMIRVIAKHAEQTAGRLQELAEDVAARYEAVRERLYKFAGLLHDPQAEVPARDIRVAVNDLLIRLAVAILTYAKGSGFIRQQTAQRLAREAMFFLVWSAPEEVRADTLASFLALPQPETKSMAR